jgi:hypothetical protein
MKIFGKRRYIYKDDKDGIWKTNYNIKYNDFKYQEHFLKYLNLIEPIFNKAKEKSEFEFICTLVKVQGYKDAGWDPFENLEQINKSFQKIFSSKTKDNIKANQALFLYGLILEASEPYNTLSNLLNIIEGDRYTISNFPNYTDDKGRSRTQHPLDKISQLIKRAKKNKLDLSLFNDFFDNNLRNAVFHSDFVIHWPEVRILNPNKRYSRKEWMIKVNQAMAYLNAYINVKGAYIKSYTDPKIIEPHPDFQVHPNGEIITIIRENHGILGLKDNWSKEDLKRGMIPFYFGMFHRYELKLLDEGIVTMPPSKLALFNKIIKYVPSSKIRGILVKKFKNKYL